MWCIKQRARPCGKDEFFSPLAKNLSANAAYLPGFLNYSTWSSVFTSFLMSSSDIDTLLWQKWRCFVALRNCRSERALLQSWRRHSHSKRPLMWSGSEKAITLPDNRNPSGCGWIQYQCNILTRGAGGSVHPLPSWRFLMRTVSASVTGGWL